MPSVQAPDGTTKYIPGVYPGSEVVSDLPGALPEFHIPVIIGDAERGHPYYAQDSKFVNEADFSPFRLIKTTAAARRYYGTGSEISTLLLWAKRHGLPFAYVSAINPLTRTTMVAHSTGPVDEQTLFTKSHGAPDAHHKIAIAVAGTNVITITPVKYYAMLTATTAAADTRIFVKDNSWVRPGQGLEIGANGTANVAKVVADVGTELDSNGQTLYWVELTTTVGAIITAANYSMIVEYDVTNQEVSPALATGQEVFDWFNDTSKIIGSKKEATFSNAILIAITEAPFKEVAGHAAPTAGTSPAGSVTEHDDFIGDLDASEWDAFLLLYGLVPQAFLIGDDSSTIHASWRDWATTKRAEGFPVSITAGCTWGDTVTGAGNDTAPEFRAAALNSQDFMLCAGGMDKLASYLTMAPAVFGRRIGGGLNHNLTNDELIYSSLEKMWDERVSGQLTTLLRGGVTTQRLLVAGTPRFVVSEGLSTLQNNANAWNVGSNDTSLVHQRDLADFFDRVMMEDLDGKQIGADGVSTDSVTAVLHNRVTESLEKKGYVVPKTYSITSIGLGSSGAGIDVVHGVAFPLTLDFITILTQIRIGS